MHILIFHGYLLRGTGSNIYNANLAAAFVRLGHTVDLVCQERSPLGLEFVDAVGDWDSGELEIEGLRTPVRCTVYRPDIGGLLPVFVADRYKGTEARTFPELSDSELDAYIERNAAAVQGVIERTRPDLVLANHAIMGPLIVHRALEGTGTPYVVKIHGSDLEYTVAPYPRFLPYAREGIAGARIVLVGSTHIARRLWQTVDDDTLPERTFLGPPGVDVGRFRPAEDRNERRVTYLGKLIVSKGVDLLLCAWPLVLAEMPDAELRVIGFGTYEDALRRMAVALAEGDLESVRALALEGRAAEGGTRSELTYLLSFLDQLEGRWQESYLAAARGISDSVVFSGRFDHEELAGVLPFSSALVVPSTFPEAFGMVAIEAAACGVFPVCAEHSGLAEVAKQLAIVLPVEIRDLLTFELGSDAVSQIARRLVDWLSLPASERKRAREALVELTRSRFSWEAAANNIITAAKGNLGDLTAPSAGIEFPS